MLYGKSRRSQGRQVKSPIELWGLRQARVNDARQKVLPNGELPLSGASQTLAPGPNSEMADQQRATPHLPDAAGAGVTSTSPGLTTTCILERYLPWL